jgi:hypothetical protein
MHFADKRTRGIQHREIATRSLVLDCLRHPMGAENSCRSGGDLVQLFDEPGALALKLVNDVAIVDDLVTHVNRRPVLHESAFHDLDSTYHACAETPRLRKNYLHRRLIVHFSRLVNSGALL